MNNTKHDLTDKDDIILMVDTFYTKVNKDDILSPVFNEFSKVNWDKHLPRMYDFWNTILFSEGNYKGSPFDKHIPLPINSTHFERWMTLFKETLDELFEGDFTESTKARANLIAYTFESKLGHIHQKK